jgi:Carboxypeptidase regulatory-like domain
MRKAPFRLSSVYAPVVLLLFSSFSYAQFNASLSGTVADPTGAVIPGATVTLRSNATQAVRTATSGSQGTYQFSTPTRRLLPYRGGEGFSGHLARPH